MNILDIYSDVGRCESGVSECTSTRGSDGKQQEARSTAGKQARKVVLKLDDVVRWLTML